MSGIRYIDYYIPDEKMPLVDFLGSIKDQAIPPSFKDKKEYEAFVKEHLQLQSFRIETKRSEAEMLDGLLKKMFDTRTVKPEDIDIIMVAREPGAKQGENLAKFLQHKYKMNRSYTMNISGNHCANIDVAVKVAVTMLRDQSDIGNILIISTIKTEKMENRIFGTYGILGDAAGIMLVSKEKSLIQLLESDIISIGMFHNIDVNADTSLLQCKYYARCLGNLLQKKSVKDDMIEKIVIQNAYPLLVTQCIESRGLDTKKIFTKNMGKYGHMDCLDFLINLKDVTEHEIVNRDRFILTFGTGFVGTYISCLFSLQ